MLMRFAKVTPEGKYVPPPPANSKASFSTMVYVRATIVEDAGEYLARAATIAVSGLLGFLIKYWFLELIERLACAQL